MLFELSITNSNDWNDRNGIAYLYAENRPSVPGYGDVCATKKFVELLAEDPQDVRADVFLAPSADKKHVFNGAKVLQMVMYVILMYLFFVFQKFISMQLRQLLNQVTRQRLHSI